MSISDYDRAHIGDLIHGEGSWFTARLVRALNDLLPHADPFSRARIVGAFPEEVAAITAWYAARSEATRAVPGEGPAPLTLADEEAGEDL